jgi:hypothetical protein
VSLWLTAMWDCRQPESLATGYRLTEPTLRSRYCGGPPCVLCPDHVTEQVVARVMSLLVRPDPPPLWLGLVAAAAGTDRRGRR